MKQHGETEPKIAEISVTSTLLRTIGLVGLTIVLACLIRFVPFLGHGVQWVAGTDAWQSLYALFGIDSSLGREQLILVGIMLSCFVVALGIQALTVVVSGKIRASRRRGG
ncbi:hypothetical protein [Asaia krungthepensis]|uniref:Uncharacterized protein n=1 Tax=Asaia krungthepensis NRIC 0535 TaxID=1307925 RepID=A0ABQ0Q1Z4_9PROT|nr:hypothetical protein [Asaia krungthepensis]GBQ87524.1 hypothetical protein AA0535_1303 [Asaia krungthepensis NRIC 0535]